MASWSATRRSSSPASRPACRRGCRKPMAEAAEQQDYELAAVYRDRLRALTYIQGSQTVHAEGLGDADVFALACKGGHDVDPGLLHPRRAELGASRLLPGAYQRRSGSRGVVELSRPVLRGHAAAAADPGRPRAAPTARCSRRRCRERAERKVAIETPAARRPAQADRPGARAMPRRRSTAGSPRPRRRARSCASSPTRSSWPTCPSGSRSTTTATSWAPTRPAR